MLQVAIPNRFSTSRLLVAISEKSILKKTSNTNYVREEKRAGS